MLVEKIKNEIEEVADRDETTVVPFKVFFNDGNNLSQVTGECKNFYNDRFSYENRSLINVKCWRSLSKKTTCYDLELNVKSGLEDTISVQYKCSNCSCDDLFFDSDNEVYYCPICG